MPIRWRDAMSGALYGAGGFFVAGTGPADHFRTSVHASPAFATALLRLLTQVDRALGHPSRLDVVDVGAGRGELLLALTGLAVGVSGEPAHSGRSGFIPPWSGSPETPTPTTSARLSLAERVRFTAVEYAPRPENLPQKINWTAEIPDGITGLLIATEWLDNVPLDTAVHTEAGWRYLLVDPETGAETIGEHVTAEDHDWLARWWPHTSTAANSDRTAPSTAPDTTSGSESGFGAARPAQGSSLTARSRSDCPETPHRHHRAEIGRTRDEAWASAVQKMERGLAVAVDYGHLRAGRPVDGTLTGYRDGRQVHPIPDGSSDVTAHVAMDSVASAGAAVARCAYSLVSQRKALRALGADGGRPPLSLAGTDPAGYVRALAAASTVAELTDPAGLGGHWWLRQPVGIPPEPPVAR
ncbi:SAM-dependent methyltransferase [Micromonospora sp. WMMD1120]|uniref:SAM-dependent methyltransferase n=1 Tax=Micromonospora sp. WMMD1120 TaxID=3016106 RepID=UPI002416356A|nr:SAM-dependent methyltransferase [Micromonospora sp. WMMD1120]MDG4806615.1 SAM-dependent methyltransferase [Micromonospora sp. WMMD1120]